MRKGAGAGVGGAPSSAAALGEPGPSERARSAHLHAELGRFARSKLSAHMASLILAPSELELLWRLLRQHASPPLEAEDERINYDDFCQVADAMPAHCGRSFFCASHFVKFYTDGHGRISLLDFFQ